MKRIFWRIRLIAALAPFAFLAPSPANALLCTPILGCTCSASATALAFTMYPLTNSATNSTADITVNCTGVIDALPQVSASFTTGQSGQFSDRVMTDGARQLHYNFYTDSNRTLIAGNGAGGTSTLTISGGLITLGAWSRSAPLYGRIPAAPLTVPGTYTDSVTVRIDY